ncbi:MAG: hypothetical protein HYW86_05395 [Candidatus Roizmanbacteria bacterium]|nr:MAG: hypothetical protein HYW86_05395 [Candidatus Roizmanbacteria bacterium]
MSKEDFTAARHVLTALQSDEMFTHANEDSRGIRVNADSLVFKIADLATQAPSPEMADAISWMGTLVYSVSQDYGTYVRVKGGNKSVSIDLRGHTGPLPDDPSFEELTKIMQRASGIYISCSEDEKNHISAHASFLELNTGEDLGQYVNGKLKRLSDQQRQEVATKFIGVIKSEVAESGEFLDLAG